MFRLLQLSLLIVCLIAVAYILYGYYKGTTERRRQVRQKDLEGELTDYLKQQRKE